MSHLTTIKTQIKDRECLLKALRETLPNTEIAASEHSTANNITSIGFNRSQNRLCNIVARKAGGYNTDIGFQYQDESQNYSIVTDHYTPEALIGSIKKNYVKATAESFAAKKGMKMTTKICPTTNKTIYTLTKQAITTRR